MARFLEMNRPKSARNLAELFCDLGRMLGGRVHLGAGTKRDPDEARSAEANTEAFTPYQPPWFAGAAWGTLLCAAYPLLILTPLALFAVVSPNSHQAPVVEGAVDCAVVAFTILALQFVISARLRWLEAPFGLDVVLRFHRTMALVAAGLLCIHPLLLASGESWGLLTRWRVHWPIWAGRLALLLLAAHVAAAIFRRVLRLRYETWRHVHNAFAFLLLGLAFLHSLALGHDFSGKAARTVWAALPLIALSAWLYARLVRPWLLGRRSYRVVSIASEAPQVWTLTLEAPVSRPLHYAPGQFQFLRAQRSSVPAEEHPFSIASSPAPDGRISLTIKESGDFTSTIGRIKPGDWVAVHGPFGRFSHVFHPEADDLVFVAAGIGITPFMSMLRYMRDRQDPRRVLLVYANRGVADMVFRSELEQIESGGFPALTTIHILSRPPGDWAGRTGRLDTECLSSLCGGFSGKAFFICCPPIMASALIRGLRNARVGPERIHADYFGL
jgi:predicted ferric reductase